jgi:gamma-glutamylcyclotransferase (GGCT)/AIG2-like uncharacterized protein YtfP
MAKQRDHKTGRWMPLNPKNVLKPMVPVFVFGTLKRSHSNHRVMGNHYTFLGAALTFEKYDMFDTGFPVILENPEGRLVKGEAFLVPPAQLEALDRLEGEGRMYFRKVVKVSTDGIESMDCYIYVGNPEYWRRLKGKPIMRLDGDATHVWPEPKFMPVPDSIKNLDFGQVEQRVTAGVMTGRLDPEDMDAKTAGGFKWNAETRHWEHPDGTIVTEG